MKTIIRGHADILFGSDSQSRYGEFDQDAIFSATNMKDLDDHYTRRRLGFKDVNDFYDWSSCRTYLQNVSFVLHSANARHC